MTRPVVEVADIGFPADAIATDAWLVERADAAALVPVRAPDAHKRSTGVVLVVAGSRDMTGAPVLAASQEPSSSAAQSCSAPPNGTRIG